MLSAYNSVGRNFLASVAWQKVLPRGDVGVIAFIFRSRCVRQTDAARWRLCRRVGVVSLSMAGIKKEKYTIQQL